MLNNLDKVADILPHLPAAGGGGGGASIGGVVTGATDGSILFVGAGGVLAEDNANFFYDDTDNQLVLGAGTAAKPSLIFGDDSTGVYRPALNQVGISTIGVARWFWEGTGHLKAATDNLYDIGGTAAANRPRNLYLSGTAHAATAYRIGTDVSSSWLVSISTNLCRYLASTGAFGHQFAGSAAASTGAHRFMDISPLANTGQTLSTEIPGFSFNTFTRTWATGAIADQREFRVNAPTYAFVGASTITNAATLYVSGPPIAGANATITNSWAAWFGAKIRIDGAIALGGGAAATFGTIGGTGPAAAAQNEWIEVWTQNGKRFIPAWA